MKITKYVCIWAGDEIPFLADFKLFDSLEDIPESFKLRSNFVGAFPVELEVKTKATKWFNVYRTGESYWYETESEAKAARSKGGGYLGTYPLEIQL